MHPYRIRHNLAEATGLRRIELDAVTAPETRPGQYVKLALSEGEKPTFLAIASCPGEPLTLLVKVEGPVATALCEKRTGEQVYLSEPLGRGFALERTENRDVIVLCNGSGISAIRPAMRALLDQGAAARIHLYYGVLSPDRIAFTADIASWREAGAQVQIVVDPSAPESASWERGYVQDRAEQDGWIRSDVAVVLVGVPAMIEDAKARFRAAGCDDARLLTNF
jgi:NAD(P)H-flavin reductase